MALLTPGELAMLERVALGARGRLLGAFVGGHRSPRFGSSLDFADYREYRPGDDFRRIDAAVSARLDRLFLRLFEAEEDVPIRIVVDGSASMGFGSPSKLAVAQRVAATLAHVALLQHDRVRLYAAGGPTKRSRWFGARGSVHDAMAWLEALTPTGAAQLGAVIRSLRDEGRAGITAVLTDLLEEGWEEVLARLGPPGEAFVVQVLAPEELDPPLEGDLTLVDAESGQEVAVSIDARTLAAYRKRVSDWRADVRATCGARAIRHAFVRAEEADLSVLLRRLMKEHVLR